MMYVEFDSHFADYCCVLKAPDSLSHTQIKKMFQQAINTEGRDNVISYFVHQFGFQRVKHAEDIEPFFIIDLDTDQVYRPSY